MIKLSTPTDLPWYPVIADATLDEAGVPATVIGWGATNRFQNLFPTIQQEVEVPIVANATANGPLVYNGDVTAKDPASSAGRSNTMLRVRVTQRP